MAFGNLLSAKPARPGFSKKKELLRLVITILGRVFVPNESDDLSLFKPLKPPSPVLLMIRFLIRGGEICCPGTHDWETKFFLANNKFC